MVFHAIVVGFHNSDVLTAPERVVPSLVVPPPTTRTVPSGSMTLFMCARAKAMDEVCTQWGEGTVVSRTKVVLTELPATSESMALPVFMNFPGRYMTPLLPSTMLGSSMVQVWVATLRTRVTTG